MRNVLSVSEVLFQLKLVFRSGKGNQDILLGVITDGSAYLWCIHLVMLDHPTQTYTRTMMCKFLRWLHVLKLLPTLIQYLFKDIQKFEDIFWMQSSILPGIFSKKLWDVLSHCLTFFKIQSNIQPNSQWFLKNLYRVHRHIFDVV